MNPKQDNEGLMFSSIFESGNLDKVVRTNRNTYDLYLRTDTNTGGHYQWFYFKVINQVGERTVNLNILNFSKSESLYTQGMTPCVWTASKGWHRLEDSVQYTQNRNILKNRLFCTLSFSCTIPEKEIVWFAQSVPYTYTDMLRYINQLDSQYLEIGSLCKTLSGIEVPLLTITEQSSHLKELVVVTARVHPSETHSSFVMEGFLNYLLSSRATEIRKRCVFKIVPMLNPDGVIVGNSRCNFAGDDLNRQFRSPNSRLHPTVHSLKKMLKSLRCKYKFLAYMDFHSHFQMKGSFIYGPHFPLHSSKHYRVRIIPKLISETTEAFRYHSCRFQNSWAKRNTARLVISRECKLPFSFTVESSLHGYFTAERTTKAFSVESLQDLGDKIASSVYKYIKLALEEQRLKEMKKMQRLQKKNSLSPRKLDKPNSPPKSVLAPIKRRTMQDVINAIKADPIEEDEEISESESESEQTEEHELIKANILDLLDQVNSFSDNLAQKDKDKGRTSKINVAKKEEVILETKKTTHASSIPKKNSRSSSSKKRIYKKRENSEVNSRRNESCVKTTLFRPLEKAPVKKSNEQRYNFKGGYFARAANASEQKITFCNFSESESNLLAHLKTVIQPLAKKTPNFSINGKKLKNSETE